MDIDLEELAAIIELLDTTDFTDFRFEKGELKIAVRRGGLLPDESAGSQPAALAPAAPAASAPAAVREAPAARPTSGAVTAALGSAASAVPVAADGHVLVTSPMLGTFYGAAKPGEAAFVQVGSTVDADSTLCIVEVMKLMTSVAAGASGEITAVFANDGDLVEFGQPLFEIRQAA